MTGHVFETLYDKCVVSEEQLINLVAERPRARIQTVNLHHLALAKHSRKFSRLTETADYVTADGWPIVAAARALGRHADRVTGSEFTQQLVVDQRLKGLRIGLLGASTTVGDGFQRRLESAGVVLAYREHGRRDDWNPSEIAESLASAEVDLLLVAVTPPFGDEIADAIHNANFQGTVMAVGGAVDMFVAARKAAPRLVKVLNLEWVFRMVQEPGRLFARYIFLCLPVFVTDVLPVILRGSTPR